MAEKKRAAAAHDSLDFREFPAENVADGRIFARILFFPDRPRREICAFLYHFGAFSVRFFENVRPCAFLKTREKRAKTGPKTGCLGAQFG